MQEQILTTAEVAQLLRVDTETVFRWRQTGKIPYFRVNPRGRCRYLKSDIERLVQERMRNA